MKKMSVVLGLLLAVLVMGCGIYESYGFDYKQLSSIERGMSFKEVCTISVSYTHLTLPTTERV